MKKRKVPELSLMSYVDGTPEEQSKFCRDLFIGFKDYGFIILKDHPIASEDIDMGYQVVKEFFYKSKEYKESFILEDGKSQRGFTRFGQEHAKDHPFPDLKEFWHVGREVPKGHEYSGFYPDNIWPKDIKHFKECLSRLYDRLDYTSNVVLEALGNSLDTPKDFFREMIKNGNSILRPIFYPEIPENAHAKSVRAAAHEDINLITLLMGATDAGLELLDRNGEWLKVETKPGQIVVDSGDMMLRITNGLIPATTHRVVNPDNSKSERFSMPFFVHPHPKAVLSCIPSCRGNEEKYSPIGSHEFLMQRLEEIGLAKEN